MSTTAIDGSCLAPSDCNFVSYCEKPKWIERKPKNEIDNPDLDTMEAVSAEEMKHLTGQEREMAYEELHGVSDNSFQETAELIETSLTLLKYELESIPIRRKRAYNRALFLKPNLATDRTFQIKFLRADRYDVAAAAQRMCRFFEEKLKLFGDKKLVKTITLDDLDDNDISALCNGAGHLLPTTDRSGRVIFFADYYYLDYKEWKNVNRIVWYMAMTALEDENVQTKGFVECFYCSGALRKQTNIVEHTTKGLSSILCIPIRLAGIHFCYDDPNLKPIIRLAQIAFGSSNRLRFRSHFGSNTEILYELMPYGIRVPERLVERDESFKQSLVDSYLSRRRQEDDKYISRQQKLLEDRSIVEYPGPHDVLMGKGRSCQEYYGNINMNQLVDRDLSEYKNSKARSDKARLAIGIVEDIRKGGGRFLERQADGWQVVVDETVMRNKITQAFRVRNRGENAKVATQDKDDNDQMISTTKKLRVK